MERNDTIPLPAGNHQGGFRWIRLHDPADDEIERLGEELGLHRLIRQRLAHPDQVMTLEAGDSGDLLSIPVLLGKPDGHRRHPGIISAAIGEGYIVCCTYSHSGGEAAERLLDDAEKAFVPERAQGPQSVLRQILLTAVEAYLEHVEGIGDRLETLEGAMFDTHPPTSRQIYELKRDVLRMRRVIGPLALSCKSLAERHELRATKSGPYFGDLQNRLDFLEHELASHDTVLSDILTTHLAEVSVKQNEDMRKISAWAAILAIPTMVAGIYGMNFKYMPELSWSFGYPASGALMVAVCAVLFWQFRRIRWL